MPLPLRWISVRSRYSGTVVVCVALAVYWVRVRVTVDNSTVTFFCFVEWVYPSL